MKALIALAVVIGLTGPVAKSTPMDWEEMNEMWNDPCPSDGPCVVTVCDSIKFCRQARIK